MFILFNVKTQFKCTTFMYGPFVLDISVEEIMIFKNKTKNYPEYKCSHYLTNILSLLLILFFMKMAPHLCSLSNIPMRLCACLAASSLSYLVVRYRYSNKLRSIWNIFSKSFWSKYFFLSHCTCFNCTLFGYWTYQHYIDYAQLVIR